MPYTTTLDELMVCTDCQYYDPLWHCSRSHKCDNVSDSRSIFSNQRFALKRKGTKLRSRRAQEQRDMMLEGSAPEDMMLGKHGAREARY